MKKLTGAVLSAVAGFALFASSNIAMAQSSILGIDTTGTPTVTPTPTSVTTTPGPDSLPLICLVLFLVVVLGLLLFLVSKRDKGDRK